MCMPNRDQRAVSLDIRIYWDAERLSSQTRVTVEPAKTVSTSAPLLPWPSSRSAKQGKTMTRHCEAAFLLAALDVTQHGITPLRSGMPAAI